MNSKGTLTTILIWFALTLIFTTIGVFLPDWPHWHSLAEHGVEVEGTVIAKEPENHQFIRYSYVVGGATYSGLGSAGHGNPKFERLNVGDRIKVFYDSENPKESISGNAEEQASSITTGVLFMAVVGPLLAIFGLHRKGWLPFSR